MEIYVFFLCCLWLHLQGLNIVRNSISWHIGVRTLGKAGTLRADRIS